MSNNFSVQFRHLGATSLFLIQGTFAVSSAGATCYGTPNGAIEAIGKNAVLSPALKNGGYRVTRVQSDPVLGQRWAMIASCSHPEWPPFALPANEEGTPVAPQETDLPLSKWDEQVPVVHAGDIVQLWKQERLLRIEVSGVSEESGSLGKTIRVRLLRKGTDNPPEEFSGIVRGQSEVEILP